MYFSILGAGAVLVVVGVEVDVLRHVPVVGGEAVGGVALPAAAGREVAVEVLRGLRERVDGLARRRECVEGDAEYSVASSIPTRPPSVLSL